MRDHPMEASARACANIALAKYWGKADVRLNVPAVPSISLTLDQLVTETRVCFDESLPSDLVRLDGRRATPAEAERVIAMLDRVRREARGTNARARHESQSLSHRGRPRFECVGFRRARGLGIRCSGAPIQRPPAERVGQSL